MSSGAHCVVEVHLKLSYEAMQAMAMGEELSIEIEEEDLRVCLAASDEAVARFKDAVQKTLLVMAPSGPHAH